MRKLTALLLVVAVPALAQQQVSLLPSVVQADVPAAIIKKERPLHERAETWVIAGVTTVAVAAVITGLVVLGMQISAGQQRQDMGATKIDPGPSSPRRVMQSDFRCDPQCDGFINQPLK